MSYSQAEQRVQEEYMSSLHAGAVTPASSVVGSLNFVLLVSWLMVSRSIPEVSFQRSRLPVFVCITCISSWNLLYVRSVGVIGSVGVGLNSALCTIIAVNFMILHDPRAFARLMLQSAVRALPEKGQVVLKRVLDVHDESDSKLVISWEPMPKHMWRRFFWVLDLITGFRGVHWSWKFPPLPPYYASLGNPYSHLTTLFSYNTLRFVIDYFFIDMIKCMMVADPYFINYPTRSAPPHIAPYVTSPLGLYSYRMLLALAGVSIVIDLIFSFAVLLQVNILGPQVLGLNGSPNMFPPLWGSPHAVLSKGLRGFWGETWHQMFRMHFVSIGDAFAGFMLGNKNLSTVEDFQSAHKWQGGRLKHSGAVVIRVMTVFLISGAVHAAASYTLLGPSRPWASFTFFALQPLGIAIQTVCSRHFVGPYLSDSASRWKVFLRQISNMCFTVLWLWACSGLLLDDFTSGGVWMFEPVPVSLIRGLGFSKEEKRFWCW